MSEPKRTNALAGETSPYLLQHAHNPVDWHPWGERALKRARDEDKPILLSVGYSACHWCHVMERESFENEEIAELMNRNFINIKVDREERPDLDAIYMNAVQMMTGRGGWPMTVFLTPDQVPFYGGTYFPPEDRMGMPGFGRILQNVARAYREKKELIERDAAAVIDRMIRTNDIGTDKIELSTELLDRALSNLVGGFDTQDGGFAGAPKFPPSMSLSFLMRGYSRLQNSRILDVVELTLEKMANGGMYDQLGGGFHRYSVDSHWLVPHFEKMLYDNALLSRAYLDAFLLTEKPFYRKVAEETLDYVRREMTSPEGGFYSTQDADSEGEEGKYYVWTRREVVEVLGEGDAELFCRYYDVTEEGNFEEKNILNVPRSGSLVARLNGVAESDFWEIISRGKRSLLRRRDRRVKPGRDEKILTAWNGLMIRSFAEAAASLEREDYRRIALGNAEFVLSNLRRNGRLLRSYKDGKARFNGYLEDYANLIDGLLALYEASFETRWVREAEGLAEILVEQFGDPAGGGFFLTSRDHEGLIHRPRDLFDNATPAGNSVAVHALLRLWKLTGVESWRRVAEKVLEGMAEVTARHPSAFSHLLCGLDFALAKGSEIAVVGDPASARTRDLLQPVFRRYLPNKVVACGSEADPPLLREKRQLGGKPTAYVCENFVCNSPVTDPADLERLLALRPPAGA